jgi:hypothetical protein
MRITTPTTIEQVAWEGDLIPLGETFRGGDSPGRATLGEPAWWPAAGAIASELGQNWTPPAGDRRYLLVRFMCALDPARRQAFAEATLTAYLRPRSGGGDVAVHDLHPRRLLAEQTGKRTIKLAPSLNFAEIIDLSLGELGLEIDYHKAFPIITGFIEQPGKAYWQFKHHAAHPLLGVQSVYVVLAVPPDAGGVRLSLELVASPRAGFGRYGLPESAHISRIIGE